MDLKFVCVSVVPLCSPASGIPGTANMLSSFSGSIPPYVTAGLIMFGFEFVLVGSDLSIPSSRSACPSRKPSSQNTTGIDDGPGSAMSTSRADVESKPNNPKCGPVINRQENFVKMKLWDEHEERQFRKRRRQECSICFWFRSELLKPIDDKRDGISQDQMRCYTGG
ncbi:uncharacterized protein BCR38DRAFT_103735 [Pseudomassariella vexata]|uniref:Uncharacterized protein n=1 Tax=Pseudomassariella vexata TaxID=1141098 RepID=A0A1Y2EHM9_9PEZI|nr:uncharacterized protein BCR38DRAFT_103735 [Pseudomassariella vexata]ORY70285.1 hypothetical protein BCR38DRAFT_103735 [Pseudomassariella vexata]